MKIEILHLIEGAKNAKGLTVIIDVFRAFSLQCYFFNQGVSKIIPVATVEEALFLKKKHPEYILAGERDTKKIPGFDYGNSPFQILGIDFTGKTIVHTTSSGVQGILNAKNASKVITGSFVNAEAIVNFIKLYNPDCVSLVCMGFATQYPVEEDTLCAEYIKEKLLGNHPDFKQMIEIIKNTSGQRFFDPYNQEHCPEQDFYLCLELNKFNFIIQAIIDEGKIVMQKIDLN